MKITELNLPLTWSVLYVGLKESFITQDEVIKSILNKDSFKEQDILELIEVQDDENEMLKKLESLSKGETELGGKTWQAAYLLELKNSDLKIEQKLKEIEKLWNRFGYPDSWRDFIYYIPTSRTNSPELVYVNMISFLNEEIKALRIKHP